jgi:hypothetical protein
MIRRLLLVFAVFAFAVPLLAQTTPPEAAGFDWMAVAASAITAAIPVLTMLLVGVVRKFLPKLPSWSIPLISLLIGIALNVIQQASMSPKNALVGAVLGLAATGLYEVQKHLTPQKPD